MTYDELLELLTFDPRLLRNNELEVIVRYSGDLYKIERETGLKTDVLDPNFAIISGEVSKLASLYSYSEIQALELPKTLSLYAESGRNASCVPEAYSPPYSLSGDGTLVCVIDSGIDYTHPEFLDPSGGSRILYAWDMTYDGNDKDTKGFQTFGIGKVYGKSELDAALRTNDPLSLVPFTDRARHGTAVAAVAAGSRIGVARQAGIVAVKLGNGSQSQTGAFSTAAEIMRALHFAAEATQKLSMPAAVNLSYGTNNGGHSGDSLFESYIDEFCLKRDLVLCTPTGNEGATGHHFSAYVQSSRTDEISFSSSGSGDRFYVTLWKNFVDSMSFSVVSPSGASTPFLDETSRFYFTSLGTVRLSVYFEQPSPSSYSQEIYFVFESGSGVIPPGLWQIKVRGTDVTDGRIDAWLPTVEDVGNDTVFLSPDNEITLTLPSTAKNVISVGGYDETTGNTAPFSGVGYTRENVFVKPDLCAPCVDIVSASPNGSYSSFTGTSFASPFVCGGAALLLEWGVVKENDPLLYGQRLKAFLRKGARRTSGLSFPSPERGYGALCLSRTLSLLTKYDGGTL